MLLKMTRGVGAALCGVKAAFFGAGVLLLCGRNDESQALAIVVIIVVAVMVNIIAARR